jgi:hypothetical protein
MCTHDHERVNRELDENKFNIFGYGYEGFGVSI